MVGSNPLYAHEAETSLYDKLQVQIQAGNQLQKNGVKNV